MSFDPEELRAEIKEVLLGEVLDPDSDDHPDPCCYPQQANSESDDEEDEEDDLDEAIRLLTYAAKVMHKILKADGRISADDQWDLLGIHMGIGEFLADFED